MTKSKTGRRPDKRQRLLKHAVAYWELGFYIRYGRRPRPMLDRDRSALADIAFLQCAGDVKRTFATLRELVDGPFKAWRLSNRWVELIDYYESGKPRRARSPSTSRRRELWCVVSQNARLARSAFGGAS